MDKLAERERFELAVWFSDLFILVVARRPPLPRLAWRLGGDSSKAKGRPEGRPFKLMPHYQHDIWLRIEFEPMTFRL
jgi:hypothetical protein